MAIGIGGSVGSGIFVTSGQIASTMGGPASAISWLVSGIVCAITCLAYAELAAIVQSAGSAYAFSYYGLGELFAIISAFLLSLEYGFSGSIVSQSWGTKLAYWFIQNDWIDCEDTDNCWVNAVGGSPFNPAAIVISVLMLSIILSGVKLEKWFVDILVFLKVLIVVIVLITAACYFDSKNLSPYNPTLNDYPSNRTDSQQASYEDYQEGFNGILAGAASAFFGFIGFDEVTCMSQEAKNPKKDIPRATLATITFLTVIYFVAATLLTGMVPWYDINPDEGFGDAFEKVGAHWASQMIVIGEIFIIFPTVILVSYMPQARVLALVARDGLFPRIFAKVSKTKGNLFWGTLIMGIVFTIIAAIVPFDPLYDFINCGILLSFVFTNLSLMLVRTRRNHRDERAILPLTVLTLSSLALALVLAKGNFDHSYNYAFVGIFGFIYLAAMIYIFFKLNFSVDQDTFTAPFVPILPSLAIFFNWYLFSVQGVLGICLCIGLVVLALLLYMTFGIRHVKSYEISPMTSDLCSDNINAKVDFSKNPESEESADCVVKA